MIKLNVIELKALQEEPSRSALSVCVCVCAKNNRVLWKTEGQT